MMSPHDLVFVRSSRLQADACMFVLKCFDPARLQAGRCIFKFTSRLGLAKPYAIAGGFGFDFFEKCLGLAFPRSASILRDRRRVVFFFLFFFTSYLGLSRRSNSSLPALLSLHSLSLLLPLHVSPASNKHNYSSFCFSPLGLNKYSDACLG